MIEVERLRRLAEIERWRLFERDGHLSVAAWLAARFRLGGSDARDAVRVARGLEAMPRTREAVDAGDMSMSAVRVLVSARDADPEAFEHAEAELVEAARLHSVADLRRVASFWRQRVERGRASGEDALRMRRALHASSTFEGMVRVDGDLDPESGESLLTALRAVLDAEARSRGRDDDDRSPAQRRADALGEICRHWLERADRPSVGGERPHLTVTVPVEALGGDPTTLGGELDHLGPVASPLMRQLVCDAAVMRVVMAGGSQPLDVGRRTPVIPPAMRRAVIVRDRTCRFPGCERPHTWVTPIMSSIGPMAERPRPRTCSCSAGATTGWCTDRAGSASRSRAALRCSPGRTVR